MRQETTVFWGAVASTGPYAHMQAICISLQKDNHTNTSSLNFYRLDALPDAQPTVSTHWRQITWLIVTNETVQENTDKQTQYKSEKVNTLKYSKTKLPWFSCLLQHSPGNEVGLFYNAPEPHGAQKPEGVRVVMAVLAVAQSDVTATGICENPRRQQTFSATQCPLWVALYTSP